MGHFVATKIGIVVGLGSVIVLGGCGTPPKGTGGVECNYPVEVRVDAKTTGTGFGSFYKFRGKQESKNNNDLDTASVSDQLQKAMSVAGYSKAEEKAKAQFEVEVTTETEDPVTGTSILGNITPYTHRLSVKAFKDEKVIFQVKTQVKSENENISKFTAYMLAAASEFFGKATSGQTIVRLCEDEESVQKIK